MKKKYNLSFALLFIQVSLLLVSCGNEGGQNPKDAAEGKALPAEIEIMPIVPKPFTISIKYKAAISSLNETVIKSELNDKVLKVNFKTGDKVKAGDIILNFPENNSAIQYEQAKAAFVNSEKSFARAREQMQNNAITQKELAAIEKQYGISLKNYESIKRMVYPDAPAEGTLLDLFVKEGTKVKIGEKLFMIGDNKSVTAAFFVTPEEKAQLKRGIKAVLTVDGKDYAGRLASVSDTIDNKSGNFRAEAIFANPSGLLKSGAEAEVRIDIYEKKSAVSVPVQSILSESGRQYVYIESGGIARKRYISTGKENGMEIEITSGLAPGDRLVISGHTMLADGDTIKTVQIKRF